MIIKTNCSDFISVSNIINYTQPAKDFEFLRGKFPYKMIYDKSSNAVSGCGDLYSPYNYINSVTNTITIPFPITFRTKWDYYVYIEQMVPSNTRRSRICNN